MTSAGIEAVTIASRNAAGQGRDPLGNDPRRISLRGRLGPIMDGAKAGGPFFGGTVDGVKRAMDD